MRMKCLSWLHHLQETFKISCLNLISILSQVLFQRLLSSIARGKGCYVSKVETRWVSQTATSSPEHFVRSHSFIPGLDFHERLIAVIAYLPSVDGQWRFWDTIVDGAQYFIVQVGCGQLKALEWRQSGSSLRSLNSSWALRNFGDTPVVSPLKYMVELFANSWHLEVESPQGKWKTCSSN